MQRESSTKINNNMNNLTRNSNRNSQQQQALESISLTSQFAQHAQIWHMCEHTLNDNIVQYAQQSKMLPLVFFLPKQAYKSMREDIGKHESSTNQTYLIDSNGNNTSQLRRKHHFIVFLKSLKFKFQLFVVYLLR